MRCLKNLTKNTAVREYNADRHILIVYVVANTNCVVEIVCVWKHGITV